MNLTSPFDAMRVWFKYKELEVVESSAGRDYTKGLRWHRCIPCGIHPNPQLGLPYQTNSIGGPNNCCEATLIISDEEITRLIPRLISIPIHSSGYLITCGTSLEKKVATSPVISNLTCRFCHTGIGDKKYEHFMWGPFIPPGVV